MVTGWPLGEEEQSSIEKKPLQNANTYPMCASLPTLEGRVRK
jgi:hypothetical protein